MARFGRSFPLSTKLGRRLVGIDQNVEANSIAATTVVHAPARVDQEVVANSIAAATTVFSPSVEQIVSANAIAAPTTVHSPDRIDQEINANAIPAATTVHAPAEVQQGQTVNANAIAATTTVHSPAAEGGVQPVTAEVITPIPFAIGRLSFTVEAHLTFRWRHFFGAMVAEDDTVGAETVSLSLGWTALAPVEAGVALDWGHLTPVLSSQPLSWTVTGLIDVLKAIRDLRQLLIHQAERAPQPQPLLLSRPLPVVAKRLGPVETSVTLSWGHDRELEDLLVAGIFSDTALHAWLDDAPSSVLIPAGTSDGDGEEIGKHKGHWGGGHPKGGGGGAGGAGEADGGGGGGGAGLTGEQHEALAPAKRFNAGLKGEGAFSEIADRDALDEKLDGADERLPKPVLKEPIIKADGDAHP